MLFSAFSSITYLLAPPTSIYNYHLNTLNTENASYSYIKYQRKLCIPLIYSHCIAHKHTLSRTHARYLWPIVKAKKLNRFVCITRDKYLCTDSILLCTKKNQWNKRKEKIYISNNHNSNNNNHWLLSNFIAFVLCVKHPPAKCYCYTDFSTAIYQSQ